MYLDKFLKFINSNTFVLAVRQELLIEDIARDNFRDNFNDSSASDNCRDFSALLDYMFTTFVFYNFIIFFII